MSNVLDSLIAQWDRCNAGRAGKKDADRCKRRCKRCLRGELQSQGVGSR